METSNSSLIIRAGFSWWEAWGPVAYLGFQKGGQYLPSNYRVLKIEGFGERPLLVGGLGPGAPAPPKSGPAHHHSDGKERKKKSLYPALQLFAFYFLTSNNSFVTIVLVCFTIVIKNTASYCIHGTVNITVFCALFLKFEILKNANDGF